MTRVMLPAVIVSTCVLNAGACRETEPREKAVIVEDGSDAPVAEGAGGTPTTVLYGRVIGSDQMAALPGDWQVRVTAEYDDQMRIAPRDRDSTGDLFAFKVVPGRRVRLHFEAVPYEATVTEYIEMTDERSYAFRVPDVVLERIRWSMAAFANGDGEAFGRNLEQQATLAEKTGSTDIFRANLEFYRKASEKFPDCKRRLEEFERTPRAQQITMQAERRGLPVTALNGLVMRPEALAAEQPETLLAIAKDTRVLPSIRAQALDALRASAATAEAKAATVDVAVAAVEPDSGIAASALTTVEKLGTPEQADTARRRIEATRVGKRDRSVGPTP